MEYITALALVLGSGFVFVAGLGVVRMPDFLIRMHASTKAGTLGCGLVIVAVATHFAAGDVAFRAFATTLFLLLTAPVSAHLIGRSAYKSGISLCPGTKLHTLQDTYPLSLADGDETPESDPEIDEVPA